MDSSRNTAPSIKEYPVYLFLLPLLFVLSVYVQLRDLVSISALIIAFIKVSLVSVIGFFILRWIFSSNSKSAIICFFLGFGFLFFGNIKTTFSKIPVLDVFSHYEWLLPLFAILISLAIYLVWKSRSVARISLYLNYLMFLFVMIAVVDIIWPPGNKKDRKSSVQLTSPGLNPDSLPNIYYLVFDCYPSSSYQKEMLGVEHNILDSFLAAKGFYIVQESRSNYNNTAFSIASTFQMEYLSWLKPNTALGHLDYNRALHEIKRASLFELLRENGYRFQNLSLVDFAGEPALRKETFLTTSTSKAIFYNTIWSCIRRDIWYKVTGARKKQRELVLKDRQKQLHPIKLFNKELIDSLPELAELNYSQPFFVYAHAGMPHFPYFFDSTGHPYPDHEVYGDSMIIHKERFRNYINYTNKEIIEVLNKLISKIKNKDIIILQSDHGLYDLDKSQKNDAFRNYSAFYFPDRNYSLLYPEMSNVNTFRVVLNKYFGQQLSLLKDSSSFIK